MAKRGVHYEDLLPVPTEGENMSTTDPQKRERSTSMAEGPTLSHSLAVEHPVDGAVRLPDEGAEVVDLGWNEPPEKIPKPLVGGLPNEELWMLVRRFNKQVYHVKETLHPPPGGLDMYIADEEEFSPDKLRSTMERLYMEIGVGMMGFYKHIVRIRSWRETTRTAWFCTAYFIGWMFDFLVPLFSLMLIALIVYPPSRSFLFPPAPIALVSSKGGVQKPKAGVLGSVDSATGAPEKHKGEAVEQEASNFVSSITAVALSSAAGKHPQNEPEGSGEGTAQDSVPDPTALIDGAGKARAKAEGNAASPAHDKTKVPMETAMWTKMRPFMHGLGEVTDYWERFANALEPTPPFPRDTYRLRLAAVVMPMFAGSIFLSSYMFMKGVTFGVGFGFFGDPIIWRGLEWLNKNYPNWKKVLELRNNILKGVPTNAQLTITLLRIGEANHAPLPPPPRTNEPPPEDSVEVNEKNLRAAGSDYPLNASKEELDDAITPDPSVAHQTGGSDIDASKNHKHGRKGSKILGFFKTTARGAVETAIGADKLKAKVGSEHAKDRLGAVPPPNEDLTSGPVDFKCRYHGKRGHVYITTKSSDPPSVSFSTDSKIEKLGSVDRTNLAPVWTIPISDIKELKKIGGFGWKAKLVVGWALDREVADGLEITDRRGVVWKVTAMLLRDELFNRLIAINGQKWECW